ncbi:LytTR family DNA-binding domain-containing protein [Cytophagaceae bacterium YF14B1]|uniref:LytTR family DNA-binding domain-containing protein n=1 Tax=Xanthocytophaga flava TaxID=3048013 RepID=A0AAE3U557_9BACT|nr:LytTR family DNA-binding domain-containing protein [Xanthocytophaga flavus]MDJ1480419.1 LytTR family DNA-binding domain-containing protein [Xanthocytophaga flavus]
MNLKCLLVDDEPPALEVLESHIGNVDGLEVIAKCHNAIQAFSVLQEKNIDLMFLDIKMPKLLGTDFLRTLRNPPKVIFTTAYRDYAVEGFELDAVDYLMKPISLERFLKAIAKVTKVENNFPSEEKKYQPNKDAFLYFRVDRKMVKVLTEDILYIESLKDYIKIFTTNDSKPLVVKQSMNALEEMLSETNFLRIHRSFIVSLSKIKAFTANHITIGSEELPIGRLYSHQISKALKTQI